MFRRHRAIGTIGFIDAGVHKRPLERQLIGRLFHFSSSENRRALHQAAAQAAGRTVGREPNPVPFKVPSPASDSFQPSADGYGDSHLLSGRTLRRGLKRMSALKNFCGHLVADGSGRDAYVSAQAHCTHLRRGNCERLWL